jgi:hypothetical protein
MTEKGMVCIPHIAPFCIRAVRFLSGGPRIFNLFGVPRWALCHSCFFAVVPFFKGEDADLRRTGSDHGKGAVAVGMRHPKNINFFEKPYCFFGMAML